MLYRHIRHVLGNAVAPELIEQQVVDLAQEWLTGLRNWRFLQAREAYLSPRAQISLAAATWDEAALTLTLAGAFADYDHLTDDRIEITAGTGVTLGHVEVASKTDDNTIVLASSIKATGASDVSATLNLPRIDLPLDFGSAVALHARQSHIDRVDWISPSLMNHLRSLPIVSEGAIRWKATIEYVDVPPRPVLGVFPTPTTGETETFRLVYNAGVTRPSGTDPDSTVVNWAPFAEPLLVETVRAFAMGMEPSKNQNLSSLLDDVLRGPLMRSAVNQDHASQERYGRLRNGAAQRVRSRYNSLYVEPGGPS
jgi:hypothetical protein